VVTEPSKHFVSEWEGRWAFCRVTMGAEMLVDNRVKCQPCFSNFNWNWNAQQFLV